MVHIHHVPGRLRVRIAAAKRNPLVANSVERAVRSLTGVISARSNQLTGSIVIEYDLQATNVSALLAGISTAGWCTGACPDTTRTREQKIPGGKRFASKAAESVVWYVLETAVERSVPRLLAALL